LTGIDQSRRRLALQCTRRNSRIRGLRENGRKRGKALGLRALRRKQMDAARRRSLHAVRLTAVARASIRAPSVKVPSPHPRPAPGPAPRRRCRCQIIGPNESVACRLCKCRCPAVERSRLGQYANDRHHAMIFVFEDVAMKDEVADVHPAKIDLDFDHSMTARFPRAPVRRGSSGRGPAARVPAVRPRPAECFRCRR
jgi:hypothetical protein